MKTATRKPVRAVGTMSGTSLDGLDLVEVVFHPQADGRWAVEWGPGRTVPYTGTRWEQDLPDSYNRPVEALTERSKEYARWCNREIHRFLHEEGLEQPDVIGHHGHTVHHRPDAGFTYQLGNTAEMAEGFSCPVVGNFRVDDVALGGQGAPLVPIADRLLFGNYAHCLNLGGFANTSCEIEGQRRAWDIVPVNILMNPLAQRRGASFDAEGRWAASGRLIPELLDAWEALPYFQLTHPKSLGREDVELSWTPPLIQALNSHPLEDVLHTAVEHAARRIAHDAATGPVNGAVLISGGGAFNTYLVHRIERHTARRLEVLDPHRTQFKEAAAFALLAVLKTREAVNVLASVTGARHDHSAGQRLSPH